MRRQAAAKTIAGLWDKAKSPFYYCPVEPIPEWQHRIDMRVGGLVTLPEPVVNEETRTRYIVGSLIEEAITSSQIEGATTTRRVAREMLRTGRPPRDLSERMILNNYVTMDHIRDVRGERLSRDLLFDLHSRVTADTLDDASASGRFRTRDEPVAVMDEYDIIYHDPPAAAELEDRLERMCAFANGDGGEFVHPVIRAIVLHFWLGYDHPFVDGNGRTARALFYWCMLHYGYWLFEFVSVSQIIQKARAKYARAFLETETARGDLTYFILYHLDVIERAIAELEEYIQRKTNEIRTSVAQLRGMVDLNYRQKDLVNHALRHPGTVYTIEFHRRSQGISYQTARTDMMALEKRGLLHVAQVGKKYVYTAVHDLARRLSE
jgi:Fic family protein